MQYWPQITPESDFAVLTRTAYSQAATLVLPPQQRSTNSDQSSRADHWVYVLAGQGRAAIDSEAVELGPGAFLLIAAGETYDISNLGDVPLELLFIAVPAVLGSAHS